MENQDKLYQQFKDAASKMEGKDFQAMESVWGKIEGKLETKALQKENRVWKKIAVAASILLVGTFGYQFLKDSEQEIIVSKESVVSVESNEVLKDTATVVSMEISNPLIKENALEIIKEDVKRKDKVAVQEVAVISDEEIPASSFMPSEKEKSSEKVSGYFNTRKFDAVGVKRYEQEVTAEKSMEDAVVIQEKTAPLLVVDGKAIRSKDQIYYKNFDAESVQYLNNPLYIINGMEYTEKELFGPNPTSPYYPLNKQEIISTTILQGESATNLYGEKGKEGVVIIATKNKKPAEKKN